MEGGEQKYEGKYNPTTSSKEPDNEYGERADVQILETQCRHEQKLSEEQHKYDVEMLNKRLGHLGKFFGHSDSAAKNITFVIVVLTILVGSIFMWVIFFYGKDCDRKLFELIWTSVVPIITLAMGYIFGVKQK